MRRTDREITCFEDIVDIVRRCAVCRLAMTDGEGAPYIVPLNFGWSEREGVLTLYFHSAPVGRKIDLMKAKPAVCVEMDTDHRLVEADTACRHGFSFSSVIGRGRIEFFEDDTAKREALLCIMRHQTGREDFCFEDGMVRAVAVYRVVLSELTAKARE